MDLPGSHTSDLCWALSELRLRLVGGSDGTNLHHLLFLSLPSSFGPPGQQFCEKLILLGWVWVYLGPGIRWRFLFLARSDYFVVCSQELSAECKVWNNGGDHDNNQTSATSQQSAREEFLLRYQVMLINFLNIKLKYFCLDQISSEINIIWS